MQLDKNACAILAELLETAGEHFGNHVCNDFDIPNTPESRELIEQAERWNSEQQWFEEGLNISPDGTKIYTQDYFLMGYFAHLFREESTDATPNPG